MKFFSKMLIIGSCLSFQGILTADQSTFFQTLHVLNKLVQDSKKSPQEFLKQLTKDSESLSNSDPKVITVLAAGLGTAAVGTLCEVGGIHSIFLKSHSGFISAVFGRALSALVLLPAGVVLIPVGLATAFASKELITLATDDRYKEIRQGKE